MTTPNKKPRTCQTCIKYIEPRWDCVTCHGTGLDPAQEIKAPDVDNPMTVQLGKILLATPNREEEPLWFIVKSTGSGGDQCWRPITREEALGIRSSMAYDPPQPDPVPKTSPPSGQPPMTPGRAEQKIYDLCQTISGPDGVGVYHDDPEFRRTVERIIEAALALTTKKEEKA
jgi:hypothetical protein